MTVTTTTQPPVLTQAVLNYAALVSANCSEAAVHLRKGSNDSSFVDVVVTAPRWDLVLLERLQSLAFSDEVRKGGVLLNVTVYFGDIFVRNLDEYSEVG